MIPDSPSQLLKNAPITRARERFDSFDEMTPAVQLQAELLMQIEGGMGLSDVTFLELIGITLVLWRDCNHMRFSAGNAEGDVREVVRSAQVDQFLNSAITGLTTTKCFNEDPFACEEPNGS